MARALAFVSLTASVSLLLAASPAQAGTFDCKDGAGLRTPPSYYACRDSRGPSPLDDCFHAGAEIAPGHPVEYHGCQP